MQGNCTDPDPSATLSLSAAESASLLPLRPYQCMVFFHDTFLMVNNGKLWIDNLYLRVSKKQTRPTMAFISLGREDSDPVVTSVSPGHTYVTRTTFQPDGQGTTIGITADTSDCTLMVDGAPSACKPRNRAGRRVPSAHPVRRPKELVLLPSQEACAHASAPGDPVWTQW